MSSSTDDTSLPSSARLARFLIYNSSFGPGEGQEAQRILFYHPAGDEERVKSQNVGFSEACTNFASVFFSSGSGEKCVQTLKTKTAFFQPEPGFWMTLTVNLPASRSGEGESAVVNYHPDQVHDSVLDALLKHSYGMFKFFMGTFGVLLEDCVDREEFKDKLVSFFTKFIPELRVGSAGILEKYRAINFLTLDKGPFLKVQCFVNRIEDEFPIIDRILFFQQSNVVWSELQAEDTRLLYYYITQTLLPSAQARSFSSSALARTPGDILATVRSPFSGHQGRYLAGGPSSVTSCQPEDLSDIKIPKVHLNDAEDEGTVYQLVVYHAISSTICMLVDSRREMSLDFYRSLDALIGPHLTNMSADLMDVFKPPPSVASSPMLLSPGFQGVSVGGSSTDFSSSVRYVYFNDFNCAMKSTLEHGALEIGPEIMRVMLDVSEDFEQSDSDIQETYIKLVADQWVIGKCVNRRKIFVVITSKCANLMDASAEVEKLVNNEFKNICLLDN